MTKEGMEQFTPKERIRDANEDKDFVKKYKVNEQQRIVDATFQKLKEQDRKDDVVKFICEVETCNSTEQIRGLADWYLNKPKVGGK